MSSNPSILDRYFEDMTKYPLLSGEECIAHSRKLVGLYDTFVRKMLTLPITVLLIKEEWDKLKKAGRVTCKLSEDYGTGKIPNSELSEQVDKVVGTLHRDNGWVYSKDSIEDLYNVNISHNLYTRIFQEIDANFQDIDTPGWLVRLRQLDQSITECKNKLVSANLRLVVKFAKRYQGLGIAFEDLIQEGNLGLMRAVEKFDPERNLMFTTYATYWIKQGFLKAMKNQNKLIRLPSHIQDSLSRINKLRAEMKRDKGREPTQREVGEAVGLDEETLEKLYNLVIDPISLDTPVARGDDSARDCLKDYIEDDRWRPDFDAEERSKSKAVMRELGEVLTSFERDVIVLRWGLGGATPHTLEEIADKLKRSRERIRQVEGVAYNKLRERGGALRELQEGK